MSFADLASTLALSEVPLRDIGVDPFVVGGIALSILAILMLTLLSFGKGREHS